MAYINVQIETSSIDTDEDVEALHRTLDEIQNLYHSFCAWKDGDKNERFETELKRFFLETIDMKVI